MNSGQPRCDGCFSNRFFAESLSDEGSDREGNTSFQAVRSGRASGFFFASVSDTGNRKVLEETTVFLGYWAIRGGFGGRCHGTVRDG
ncbi:MAG: hypothetical protein ACI87O_000855 [Planctomycetota bacterium]|jgi:hypothetical protein